MQNLPLSVHSDCAWNGPENYHVRVILPIAVSKMLITEFVDQPKGYFDGIVRLNGLMLEVQDGEWTGDEIAWASVQIDDTNCSFRCAEGALVLDMSIMKPLAGDERLDQWALEQKNTLPDLFWIEPARIIKALLSATIH